MSKAFKAGMLWLVVAALVWLVTLWRWQTTGHDVSGAEIVLQLLVLPVVLTVVLLLALWGVARLRNQAGSPLRVPGSVLASAEGGKTLSAATDPRSFSVAVVDAAVHSAAGVGVEQVLMQIRAGEIRPDLDAHLQDVDGAPVFAARVKELDVEPLRERLPAEVSDRVVRVLALLQQPADQLFNRVAEMAMSWLEAQHPGASGSRPDAVTEPTMKAHLSGLTPPPRSDVNRAATLPRLTVRLFVPSDWTEVEREHLTAWLRMRCASLADEADALRDIPPALHVHALDHGDALWALVDQQAVQWAREADPQWCVLLVADSALDEVEIERRQAVGELFTGAHQTGRIPGEAAAAVLLTTTNWPGLPDMAPEPARLFRPVRLRRDKSADAAGRVGPTTLQEAMRQALSVSGACDTDLALVVADGDHRASRTAEVFEALQGVAPQLDPMLCVARVGAACGDLGLAASLVPLALAVGAVQQDGHTGVTLALNVQSPHDRIAVALLPWTWLPPSAQATT
ncbi:MAG: hypothetical protein KGL90_07545 [Burkholderiales bacterium]|nr:hypothetical protein [Burkholderiales bacterium]